MSGIIVPLRRAIFGEKMEADIKIYFLNLQREKLKHKIMAQEKKAATKPAGKVGKENVDFGEKPKSAYTLFREKYPDGIGDIVNMRAVLR
ncbi:MAG: hypothetical protein LBL94_00270 [Prevotellaceae bacterium]|nr:hypothetical protein [Prevotellaceae bacterium]